MREVSKRRKRIKLIACIIGGVVGVSLAMFLLVLAMGGAFGPDNRYYRGDYPELYTVAINSILGSDGFSVYSRPLPAKLDVIEADNHGRVLFFYSEAHPRWNMHHISAHNLIISQKSDGEYVYFYPHHNFISVRDMVHPPRSGFVPNISQLAEDFTAEAIAELKERNSWNQELNLYNAIRAPIVYTKEDRDGPIDSETLVNVYLEVFGLEDTSIQRPMSFFITDAYNRSIYIARRSAEGEMRIFVVLFQPDSSLDMDIGVMELHDLQRYQDELKALKEQNGWNQPFL